MEVFCCPESLLVRWRAVQIWLIHKVNDQYLNEMYWDILDLYTIWMRIGLQNTFRKEELMNWEEETDLETYRWMELMKFWKEGGRFYKQKSKYKVVWSCDGNKNGLQEYKHMEKYDKESCLWKLIATLFLFCLSCTIRWVAYKCK